MGPSPCLALPCFPSLRGDPSHNQPRVFLGIQPGGCGFEGEGVTAPLVGFRRGVTATSLMGMPLPTRRTTSARGLSTWKMRGMASRPSRATSSTTRRHALVQPPSRCVRTTTEARQQPTAMAMASRREGVRANERRRRVPVDREGKLTRRFRTQRFHLPEARRQR